MEVTAMTELTARQTASLESPAFNR